jgi:hypothetical protein
MRMMRGLVLLCLLALTACPRKSEVRPDPEPSVRDAASTLPRASLDGKGLHALGETTDQEKEVLRLFGELAKQWPNTREVELAIAPEIPWHATVATLDAARRRGFSTWTLTSGTAVARIDAPRAGEAMFPPALGEIGDADPCAFSVSRLEVGATDYDFDGVSVPDLEALDAKLTGGVCPSARVIVLADRERPTGRVVTAMARLLSKNRKVALGVGAPPPPLPGR